ncbi:MAG: hypothetical protein H6983_01785 [Ectothiorhodospiraceae bacterium]|nr:hypothetical protein [Ectothiorhodospiraceae bacterium]
MSYTLEQFAKDCHDTLKASNDPAGRAKLTSFVSRACTDADFVRAHLGPGNDAERTVLYEDPEFGFCILAHVYKGEKTSSPHDHGPSWAIYGQAKGVTEMTEWRKLSPPAGDRPGKVEAVRTYKMEPGDARVYQIGELHSPYRASETRLIRIEGMNMDRVKRDKYEAA